MKKCVATTARGTPCNNWALRDRERCAAHHETPERIQRRKAAARKGGKVKAQRAKGKALQPVEVVETPEPPPPSLDWARRELAGAIEDVKTHRISANEGQAISSLAKTLISTFPTKADPTGGLGQIPEVNLIQILVEQFPEAAQYLKGTSRVLSEAKSETDEDFPELNLL